MALLALSCARRPAADVIVTAGTIWTGNPAQPYAEAMALSGDSILAVGSLSEMESYKGTGTMVAAYDGQMIVPGFIDTHTHFMDGGFNLLSVQLRNASSPQEFIRRIALYASSLDSGVWILGGDWDHENWGGELPDRRWVDSVTTKNPLFLNRLDGHMALANSLAMSLAGIDSTQPDVAGGTSVRAADGRLTGIFKDNAMDPVYGAIPTPPLSRQLEALDTAMRYVAAQGVTSVHHMNGMNEAFALRHQENALTTRVYVVGALAGWKAATELTKAENGGDSWLRFGGVKGFVDGSLGSHTAAFFEPFSDSPADSGFFINTEEDLYTWIKGADAAGLQVMVHAIGDRAIHTLLNIFENVALENGPRDRRFRIEHAQHIAAADIQRFADLGVIASMQPYHAIDDGRWAERVIGPERIKTTYAFRSLLDADAKVAFGSDWFVAPPTPLEGIYAAVTRRTLDGANPDGWVPAQKILVEEALRAYTTTAAYASFEENRKGSIEPGKLADFAVLNNDLMAVSAEEIRDTQVVATYVGGKKVYGK